MTTAAKDDEGAAALETVGRRFSGWLGDNRDLFGVKRAEHAIRQLTLLKPFAEFVLCNDLLLSYGAKEPVLFDNLLWAWEEMEGGNYLFRLLLARPDIFRLASVYAPLHRQGFRNPRLETALQHVSRMRATAAAEMQPWMRLCFHHAMAQINATKHDPYSVPGTWLLKKPEPWCINDEIAYSMTHEVFYAADFGRSACSLPVEICQYLRLWVPAWTETYREAGNCDLIAEMIMVGDCLGGMIWDGEDPILTLLSQQGPDGTVPGPAGAGSLLRDGAGSAAEATFFTNYHTTLVAAMAVSLRLFRMRQMA